MAARDGISTAAAYIASRLFLFKETLPAIAEGKIETDLRSATSAAVVVLPHLAPADDWR